jgi:hypothetical protein
MQVVDKDLLLHHKSRLYAELKSILARQPGPEVAEQLSVYQASLAEREQQMHQVRLRNARTQRQGTAALLARAHELSPPISQSKRIGAPFTCHKNRGVESNAPA